MLKYVRRIIVFLVLGAIVNLSLAFIFVFIHGSVADSGNYFRCEKDGRRGMIRVTTRFGYTYVANCGWMQSHFQVFPIYSGRQWWPGEPGRNVEAHLATGWPVPCLAATVSIDVPTAQIAGQTRNVRVSSGVLWEPEALKMLPPDTIPMILPYRPLWTGVVVNTLVFAMTFSLLVYGPRQIRTRMYRGRGGCPACGYPRGTSPVCTECGEPLPSARPR
ncbi:MAG: hypothetical protein KJZ69_17880 [Phycisphaerales bacterium]|nr:hypothetical protein [Phycisphaerales bacterium]